MKKLLSLIVTLLMITGVTTACTRNTKNMSMDMQAKQEQEQSIIQPSEEQIPQTSEEQVPQTSNKQIDQVPQSNQQQVKTTPKQSTQVPVQNTTDTSSIIGEEKAKDIALQRAGISSDGVIFDRVELDRDDGIWHYEIEFRKDRTEYEADIKADDGSVISFEKDFDD